MAITQKERLLAEVGIRTAALTTATDIEKFATQPDDVALLEIFYERAFNRLAILTGNVLPTTVQPYYGGTTVGDAPALSMVTVKELNLDGQTVSYLALDQTSQGETVMMADVRPLVVEVGFREYTLFTPGHSTQTVNLSDVFVQSFEIDNEVVYLLSIYAGAAKREIEYNAPPELENAIVYWMMYEWFATIGEHQQAEIFKKKFESDAAEYRFTPRRSSIAQRTYRAF